MSPSQIQDRDRRLSPSLEPDICACCETPGLDDRGDVPGWVLVTLMTAGLVIALWAAAGPALTKVFTSAMERVTSFGG